METREGSGFSGSVNSMATRENYEPHDIVEGSPALVMAATMFVRNPPATKPLGKGAYLQRVPAELGFRILAASSVRAVMISDEDVSQAIQWACSQLKTGLVPTEATPLAIPLAKKVDIAGGRTRSFSPEEISGQFSFHDSSSPRKGKVTA
jgi:hypothetical protein